MQRKSPGKLTPGLHECHSIRELLRACTFNSVILLDCDNTLLRPAKARDLGSEHWFNKLYAAASEDISDKDELLKIMLAIYDETQHRSQVKSVEPNTPLIISRLQALGLPIYIITSRGSRLRETTERQLKDAGFDFKFESSDLTYLETDEAGKVPAYKGNVIYCDGAHKGKTAETFFTAKEIDPAHVVMVDNTKRHLNNSSTIFNSTKREFVGIHYTHLEKRESEFDMRLATSHLLSIHHLFSPAAKTSITRLSRHLCLDSTDGEKVRRKSGMYPIQE